MDGIVEDKKQGRPPATDIGLQGSNPMRQAARMCWPAGASLTESPSEVEKEAVRGRNGGHQGRGERNLHQVHRSQRIEVMTNKNEF